MPSTNDQPLLAKLRAAQPGAVLQLADGAICTLVQSGRMSGQITLIIRQRQEAAREIPIEEVTDVLWSP